MKRNLLFFVPFIWCCLLSNQVNAGDVYVEYKMSGMGAGKNMFAKIYNKNGEIRTDISIDMGGKTMKQTVLMLKSHPTTVISYNSLTKSYMETKRPVAKSSDLTIKVLGKEKVGSYNCTKALFTTSGKSFEAWFAQELPSIDASFGSASELSGKQVAALLKSKGITGMMVKLVTIQTGSASKLSMELVKYENKALSPTLFAIPAGYKKSSATFDPAKMKNMSPEQKKDLIMKMMKERKMN